MKCDLPMVDTVCTSLVLGTCGSQSVTMRGKVYNIQVTHISDNVQASIQAQCQ